MQSSVRDAAADPTMLPTILDASSFTSLCNEGLDLVNAYPSVIDAQGGNPPVYPQSALLFNLTASIAREKWVLVKFEELHTTWARKSAILANKGQQHLGAQPGTSQVGLHQEGPQVHQDLTAQAEVASTPGTGAGTPRAGSPGRGGAGTSGGGGAGTPGSGTST